MQASHDLDETVKYQPDLPSWRLWVAGHDASSMPMDDNSEATVAPISEVFESPYARKGEKKEIPFAHNAEQILTVVLVEPADLIDVVRQASKKACLNSRYFVVVDERTEKDDSVMLCQIDSDNDDKSVLVFRVTAAQSAHILLGVIVQYNFQDKKDIVDLRKEGESDILR